MSNLTFTVQAGGKETPLSLNYERVFAIGYAGRNLEKTMEHIKELERDLGVPAPKKIPTIFQCGNYVLTQEKDLVFVGEKTCGEVEYVIVLKDGKIYIGLGSDHTDRELEAQSVPKAKQICAKPICPMLWDYEEVKDHWDDIALNSWQTVDGEEVPYQQGKLADILPVETILKELNERVGGIDNCVIFSGTVPVLNGFRYGSNFRYEMADAVLGRKLTSDYNVIAISEEER
ncbi:DUF2848 family protein [Oscillibacter ruminantium]|jgi:hypothetical protein|uniref:DUF2848 family protein n=1 Tax=Oscillibacter ruminantium TaxID=1263547 RepID=UPI0003161C18|nr:DUF2848 family protein [Oscillibacter ruminantium]MDN0033893.1 DUF2848 family protein [Oscillibacter valericigenes]MEA5041113.1 DUF2848 family protein [Oscillibacter ruminantium]